MLLMPDLTPTLQKMEYLQSLILPLHQWHKQIAGMHLETLVR